MENFEEVLKRELKPLKEDIGILKRELKPLKEDVGSLKEDVGSLKEEVGTLNNKVASLNNKVGSLENKIENLDFKTDGLKKDIVEFKDEMREKLFVFEHDYGREIDAIYDKVVLNEELTKKELAEIKKNVEKNEMRAFDNSVQISSIKNQNTSSNF